MLSCGGAAWGECPQHGLCLVGPEWARAQGPAQGSGKWGDHILSTLALPWQTESKKILMNEEVERWPTPTVWERILQENSVQPWSS